MAERAEKWVEEIDASYRVTMTFFHSVSDTGALVRTLTLEELAREIRHKTARKKEALPLFKMLRFGDRLSPKGMRRHNGNMLEIFGIELDYDAEQMPFDDAVEILTRANIGCIIYTTPSYTPDKLRWRVLCPTSQPLSPTERENLVARVHGLFGGIFGHESFVESQAFYYGSVNLSDHHRVQIIPGRPVDLCTELEECKIGKKDDPDGKGDVIDSEEVALDNIARHKLRHESCLYLAGLWAGRGAPQAEVLDRLNEVFCRVPEDQRDENWHKHVGDLGRTVEYVIAKNADKPKGKRRDTYEEHDPWGTPFDFLADRSPGPAELTPAHMPEAVWPFIIDTAERMGVDPSSVALSTLVTLSSVMHEGWRLAPKRLDKKWVKSPRLWGAIIGDPSVRKSPIISECTVPIERLEVRARDEHQRALRQHKIDTANWKKDKNAKPEDEPIAPLKTRYIVEGTTVEALSEVLRTDEHAKSRVPLGKVLCRHDELHELISSFDRYTGGSGGSDRGAYLRLYNGKRYFIDRVGRQSISCNSWSACIIGGIQPDLIRKIAQNTYEDGLLQRFLFCVPGPQRAMLDREHDAVAEESYHALVRGLAQMIPDNTREDEPVITLHPDAHVYREGISRLSIGIAMMPDTSVRMKAALGKWEAQFARLLVVYHLIEIAACKVQGVPPPPLRAVMPDTARRVAIYMRDILLPHLFQADAVMFSTPQTGHAARIANLILANGWTEVRERDIQRAYSALGAPEDRRVRLEILESLVVVDWLRAVNVVLGKPTRVWKVDPQVHSMFAERAERAREQQRVAEEARRQAVADAKVDF